MGYSEYPHRTTASAQRFAVVAVAPPAVPLALQRRFNPVPLYRASQHSCARAAPRRLVRGGVRRLHAQVPLSSGALAQIPSPTHDPFVLAPKALRTTAVSLRCTALPCTGSGACGWALFGPLHAHIMAAFGRAHCKVFSTTGATPLGAAGPATLESIQSARARLPVRTFHLPPRRKLQVRRHIRSRRRWSRRWTTRAHRCILQV